MVGNILMYCTLQQIFISLVPSALKYIFLGETKRKVWFIHDL